jgi:hypothetical protein
MLVMGDTEYLVIDTSDTKSSGIGIDYRPGIVRYLHPFFSAILIFIRIFSVKQKTKKVKNR